MLLRHEEGKRLEKNVEERKVMPTNQHLRLFANEKWKRTLWQLLNEWFRSSCNGTETKSGGLPRHLSEKLSDVMEQVGGENLRNDWHWRIFAELERARARKPWIILRLKVTQKPNWVYMTHNPVNSNAVAYYVSHTKSKPFLKLVWSILPQKYA